MIDTLMSDILFWLLLVSLFANIALVIALYRVAMAFMVMKDIIENVMPRFKELQALVDTYMAARKSEPRA